MMRIIVSSPSLSADTGLRAEKDVSRCFERRRSVIDGRPGGLELSDRYAEDMLPISTCFSSYLFFLISPFFPCLVSWYFICGKP